MASSPHTVRDYLCLAVILPTLPRYARDISFDFSLPCHGARIHQTSIQEQETWMLVCTRFSVGMSNITLADSLLRYRIAIAVIKHLVAEGHSVVGTVRNAEKAAEHITSLGAKVAIVPSLEDKAALEAAFAGVDGVFHMAAVHPEYGFAETAEGRDGMLKTAVDGTVSVLHAAKAAGVKRFVLTSSLAAIECGNDEGTLTEATWSKPEVYDSAEKLEQTQWATHYTYVKSKVEQEKAAVAAAKEAGLDMRVVVPG